MITKDDLKKIKNNKGHLISDSYIDENNDLIRVVDGQKIKQIEELTENDVRKNNAINLWRMRNK